MIKQIPAITAAVGNHGNRLMSDVERFAASFPYLAVITKDGYAIGQANQSFVLIISTDGTMEQSPIPMEKTGVWMQTASIQKVQA